MLHPTKGGFVEGRSASGARREDSSRIGIITGLAGGAAKFVGGPARPGGRIAGPGRKTPSLVGITMSFARGATGRKGHHVMQGCSFSVASHCSAPSSGFASLANAHSAHPYCARRRTFAYAQVRSFRRAQRKQLENVRRNFPNKNRKVKYRIR